MTKLLSTVFLALALLTITACNPNRVFESRSSDFPDYRWYKNVPVGFTVSIEDTVSEHKLYATLRHVYGYQFTTMEISLEVTPPSGQSTLKPYTLQVMDDDGKYLADCSGDLCDLEMLLEEHVVFTEPGDWKFEITCNMDLPYVPNVMEFGVIIDKYPMDE